MNQIYKDTVRYHLHPSVFYRNYPEGTVLYMTGKQKTYHYTGCMGDILDCFRTEASLQDALNQLSTKFGWKSIEKNFENIKNLIMGLYQDGILQEEFRQRRIGDSVEHDAYQLFIETDQLYSVTMELTYKCNERCRHCYIADDNHREMTTGEIKSVLDQMAEMNVLNITFTGGEVFARKDAFEILEYAYEKNFVIDIFTNGTLIDGNDYIRLKSIWPRSVHFSLYSYIPEKHDAITRIPGSFAKTLQSVINCRAIGIPVNIKTPIFAETMEDISGMVELANSLGASIELGKNITPKKNGDLSPTLMQISGEDDERKVTSVIRTLVEQPEEKMKETAKREKLCNAGEHMISINPYGEVYPCSMLTLCIGSLKEQPLKDIWENSERLKWWRTNNLKKNREGCEDCQMSDQCIYCPGEAMMRTHNPLAKYEEACRRTKYAEEREKGGESA